MLERAPHCREDESPEGGNPMSGPVGNDWKARGGARRREGNRTLRTQGADGREPSGRPAPSSSRPLKGPKSHERDSVVHEPYACEGSRRWGGLRETPCRGVKAQE